MPPFDFWEARNEAHDALQVAIAERAPLSYIFGPGDHATYFVTPAEKSAVAAITVSPTQGTLWPTAPCYQCGQVGTLFPDSRCSKCTRLDPDVQVRHLRDLYARPVSPAPGYTSAGSSLQAPAGAVAAGAGTLLPLVWLHMVAPCGNWRARCYAQELGVRPLWGVMDTMIERRA